MHVKYKIKFTEAGAKAYVAIVRVVFLHEEYSENLRLAIRNTCEAKHTISKVQVNSPYYKGFEL